MKLNTYRDGFTVQYGEENPMAEKVRNMDKSGKVGRMRRRKDYQELTVANTIDFKAESKAKRKAAKHARFLEREAKRIG